MKKMIIFVERKGQSVIHYHTSFVTNVKSNLTPGQYYAFAKKYAVAVLGGYCDPESVTFNIVDELYIQL